MEKWPVFICYRQADGKDAADVVYNLLHEQHVTSTDPQTGEKSDFILDVYFDQAAPAGEDWTEIHEPYLKRSRAFIFVCTPGAKLNEGEDDWVHRELNWWLKNNEIAPILIDALGNGDRCVPDDVASKWPNAQRVTLVSGEWDSLDNADRAVQQERTRNRLIRGITVSGEHYLRRELEEQKAHAEQLQKTYERLRVAFIVAFCLLVVAAGAVIYGLDQNSKLRVAVEEARQAALDARKARDEADNQRDLAIRARDDAERRRLRAEGAELRALLQRLDLLIAETRESPGNTTLKNLQTERDEVFSQLSEVTTKHQKALSKSIGFRGDMTFLMRWEGHTNNVKLIGNSVYISPGTDLRFSDSNTIRERYAFLVTPDELRALMSVAGKKDQVAAFGENPILQRINLSPEDVARLVPEVAAPFWQQLLNHHPALVEDETPPAVQTALLSAAFNMGVGRINRLLSVPISNGDWAGVADGLESIADNDSTHRSLKGLAKRRREEAALIRTAVE